MAKSPAHKFGQIIASVLEASIEPILRELAHKYDLYLDVMGTRKARKGRKKITWLDLYGNNHDLDFVLERGGTDEANGKPVASIEAAWRRYTKHSRNKAQEIQGAIMPLHATHWDSAPFIGVILAGEYTDGARQQLERLGFKLLHFSYPTVVKVFGKYGIDARSDEQTADAEFDRKVKTWLKLTPNQREQLAADLVASEKEAVARFIKGLERAIQRYITLVRILPLHGEAVEVDSVAKAIEVVTTYSEATAAAQFVKYEIEIRYNNTDKIHAQFEEKEKAVGFLRGYESPLRPSIEAKERPPPLATKPAAKSTGKK